MSELSVLARRCLSLLSVFWVLALATTARADPLFVDRGAILEQSLHNHQLRKHSAARQGLRYLMRSSPDSGDEAYVLGLYHDFRNQNPWFASGGISALPSSNINGSSGLNKFTTSIGDLSINDGGNAKSGVSFSGQVEVGVGFVMGQGQEATTSLRLGRTASDYGAANRSDAFVTASYEKLGRWGSFTITPSVGFVRFDQAKPGENRQDRLQYDLSVSGERYLSPFKTAFASLSLSRYEFTEASFNNANSVEFGVGISSYFSNTIHYVARASLGRSVTQSPHTTKSFGLVGIGANMQVLRNGNFGINASMSGSIFDSVFPLLNHARIDETLSVGFSYGDSRIKLFGQTPELKCNWTRTNSNVALYVIEATDCEVALALRF